jgi:hypothetical protein
MIERLQNLVCDWLPAVIFAGIVLITELFWILLACR